MCFSKKNTKKICQLKNLLEYSFALESSFEKLCCSNQSSFIKENAKLRREFDEFIFNLDAIGVITIEEPIVACARLCFECETDDPNCKFYKYCLFSKQLFIICLQLISKDIEKYIYGFELPTNNNNLHPELLKIISNFKKR